MKLWGTFQKILKKFALILMLFSANFEKLIFSKKSEDIEEILEYLMQFDYNFDGN